MSEKLTFPGFGDRLRKFIRRSALGHGVAAKASEQEFNALALDLFALQFAHVAPYQNFCRARNTTPDSVACWNEIPALPISAFKEFDISSLEPEDRSTMFHSSGTTQHRPSWHSHNAASLALYEVSLLTTFKMHLLEGCEDIKVPFIILTPPPAGAPRSSLVHMFETARREFGANDSIFTGSAKASGAWTLDFEKTESALRACAHRNQPAVLLGTAFSFVHLLDYFHRNAVTLSLPNGARILETGGYKGRTRTLPKSELHSWLSRALGLAPNAIVSEYGMCELSSQAYDSVGSREPTAAGTDVISENPRPFRFPPWARVQIVSPENGAAVSEGEIGIIRVFDLANVRSVMAIQTEDLGLRLPEGFELLGRSSMAAPRGCSLMSAT